MPCDPSPSAGQEMSSDKALLGAIKNALDVQAERIKLTEARMVELQDLLNEAKAAELTERTRADKAEEKYKQLELDAVLGAAKFVVLVIAVGALVWVKFDSLTAIVTAPKDIFAQAEALLKDSAAAENNHTARVRFIGKALQE